MCKCGKHLAHHAPRGGNMSLSAGVSPFCAIVKSLMLHTQCHSHYCFVGTTLGTIAMADISITVIPHIICLVCMYTQ